MKKYLYIAAMIFCSVSPLWSGIEFNIRFFDRKIYYVENDPIYVQITLTNDSPETFRFKLADERVFSVDFDIRTMTNRPLPEADFFIRKRTQNHQVFFREISMESGESFSFVEDIRNYVSIKNPGSYMVQAKIYPNLYRAQNSSVIESNTINLNIRPRTVIGEDGIPVEMDVATGAVLKRERLPPDEVVDYMLKARQGAQWEKFFLYLDLESLLARDSYQKQKWRSENEDGRRKMVDNYRQRLQRSVDDRDISVIPTKFEIVKTTYNNNTGTVIVVERFRGDSYTDVRQYTYDLERRDNIWFIVNYDVEGLTTELNDREMYFKQ